jgi:hypothetical protein
MGSTSRPFVALAIVTAVACAPATPGSGDSATASDDSAAVQNQPVRLQAEVTRLEARLRELASSDGCDSAGQCKAAPVGERACGGPRDYVVYCATSTDETALLAVVDSLKDAEMRLNEATGAVSTCEMRLPPEMGVEGGRCVVRN